MGNIRFNLLDAFQQNPDQYAENHRVGQTFGLPGGLVNEDDRRAFRAKQVEDNIKMLPVSSRWFGTRSGAILAQDDAAHVAEMERATAARKLALAREQGEIFKRQMTDPGFFRENWNTAYAGFRGALNDRDIAKAVDRQLALNKVEEKGDDRLNLEIQVWDDEIAREGGLDKLPKYRQEQYLALKERQKTAADTLKAQLSREQDGALDDYLADWQKTVPRISLETERALAEFSGLHGWEKVKYFARHPFTVASHTLTDSLGRYTPAIAAGAAAAAATTLSGGTAGVATLASMGASGAVSYDTERASYMSQAIQQIMAERGMQLLSENGGVLTPEAQEALREEIKHILAGSDLQTIADEADARALSISTMDALSMGTASWLYRWGKAAGRSGVAMTGAMGASAAYGAAGEALAQKTSKGEVHDMADVAIEAIAEFMFGGFEFGAAAISYGTKRLLHHQDVRLENLEVAGNAARESRLRERDPEAFYQLAEELEEFADHPHIYLDGNALADSGLAEALLQAAPEYRDAVQQATDTGGSVQIKMADVLAKISPDAQLFGNLREHIRFEPDGLSMRELQQHGESEFAQNVESALQDQAAKDERQAQVQAIYDDTYVQLSRGGKFAAPAVESYALLNSQFYDRLAQDLGITPLEAIQQHPLQVVNGEVQGGGFEQALAEHPPRGWQHVETGEEVGQLWRGESNAQAVFWTDLQGRLETEAPVLNGYSHSISRMAMNHIANKHGNVETEALRGQIAIDENDMARIPEIVTQYDEMRSDFVSEDGFNTPRLAYVKRFDDGVYLYVEQVSRKKKDLQGISIRKYPPTANAERILANVAPPGLNALDALEAYPNNSTATDSAQSYEQAARGSYDPASGMITLTPNANLSTFIHEFGHHALETTVAVATRLVREQNGGKVLTQGEQKIVSQTDALLKSVALDLDAWHALSFEEKRPYHERIARTFETFMMTGQAPSVDLQGAFARFKAWLFSLYKKMRHLDAPLSDEVKLVFDRMLASDEAIEEMRQMRGLTPMFASAEEAGMTAEEFAAYQEDWQQAKDSADNEMHQRNARDLKYIRNVRNRHIKKLQQEAKEIRQDIEAEVREQLVGQPVYRAEEVLKIKQEGDAPLLRLSREALRTLGYSEVEIKALGRKVHQHGMHPDELAGYILDEHNNPIYDSGAALVHALLQAVPLKEEIARITDAIMIERYAELSSPAAIAEAADMAAFHESVIRAIAQEANALARATGKPSVLASAAKALAKDVIGTKVIRDLKPVQFSRMATRAAKASEQARRKGDIDTAAGEKRNQVLQAAMAREGYERKERAAKQVRYLKSRGKLDPKKIEIESREIIEAILSRFGLAQAPQQSRKLGEWIAEKEAMGYDPDIADFVLDEQHTQSWDRLTFDQLDALVDAIETLEHIGRTERKSFLSDFRLDMADITDSMAEGAAENGTTAPIDNRTPTTSIGRLKGMIRKIGWQHIRINMSARRMDGNRDGGIVWRYLIAPTNRQGDIEVELKAKITAAIAPFLESISRGSAGIKRAYTLGGKTVTLTDREIFRMATNWGNEGNRQRLLDGEGWTEAEVKALFEARLTEADWLSIQGIWDVHESMRPEVARVARKINGKEPTWVEAVPFSISSADGKVVNLRGGYVPIKKDIRRSSRAADLQQMDINGGRTARATVRSGMTRDRAERVMGQPLDYTMGSLFSGLDETIHYIAWAEWQMDMNRILGDNAFTRVVQDHYGADALAEIKKWRDDIVIGNSRQVQAGDSIAAWLRGNISMANIGFSTMSAIAQIFGLFQSVVRVGAREVGNSALRYLTNFRDMGQQADALSMAIRNRGRTTFRELADLRGQVGEQSKAKALMGKYAYWMLLRMQRAVDVITWHAQFEKSLLNGASEADAVMQADQAVIDSQGSGLTKDLSSIERGSEALKLFTVHYGFMNTILNLNANTLADKHMGVVAKFTNIMMLLLVMQMAEGAFRALITPGDDDEWETNNLLPLAAGKFVDSSLGQFVFLREFSNLMGNYEGTIGTGLFPRARKAWSEVKDGDFDTNTLRAMVSVMGATLGAPSAQINRTIKGVDALADDKTDNPMAVLFGHQE